MADTISHLICKLSDLPPHPGVYLFRAGPDVIYVGKAKALKDRVRSYFHSSVSDPKVKALVSRATDLEWIITDSEVEALILENTLIKKHQPRYNIDLKDDKRYPYLRVSVNEPFPRIEVVRQVARDGARYFGPYIESVKMRRVLKIILSVFRLRDCKTPLPAKPGTRPCLNFQIGRCAALCAGNVAEADYRERVRKALLFLSGKAEELTRSLGEEMKAASDARDFEKAADIRDHLAAIREVLFRQRMQLPEIRDRDLLAAAIRGKDACAVLFAVRDGAVSGRHHFYLRLAGGEGVAEVLERFLSGHYSREVDIPPEIMVAEPVSGIDTLERWLSAEAGRTVRILQPRIGEKAKLIDLCRRNAEMLLDSLFRERDQAQGRIPKPVEELRKALRLEKLPLTIEAYDISHFQGSETVASRVVFVGGKPKKSLYRHYNVKTVEGVDDFASMAEIVGRRARAAKTENDTPPDLMLIDGGKGQLSAAVEALREGGLPDQPVASLAKRLEEVFLPGRSDPVMIPKTSPALHLLRKIRDEAHRFAIAFHRRKSEKKLVASELDSIPGIGEKRKIALLKMFGSVEAIKGKSAEELVKAGVPAKVAEKIVGLLGS